MSWYAAQSFSSCSSAGWVTYVSIYQILQLESRSTRCSHPLARKPTPFQCAMYCHWRGLYSTGSFKLVLQLWEQYIRLPFNTTFKKLCLEVKSNNKRDDRMDVLKDETHWVDGDSHQQPSSVQRTPYVDEENRCAWLSSCWPQWFSWFPCTCTCALL